MPSAKSSKRTPSQERAKFLWSMPITVRSLSEAIGVRSVEILFKLKDHGSTVHDDQLHR